MTDSTQGPSGASLDAAAPTGVPDEVRAWLQAASIAPEVAELRPDYHAVLVAAVGLEPGPSDERSERLLLDAEAEARAEWPEVPADQIPHVAAWREAFRAFGAKPQRTRTSSEALLRRLDAGLPRIDRLTDAYNAVSIATATPLGGENIDAYQGPLQLVRATGDEEFATLASGAEVVEHPEPGEVVWRDDAGVTCRRWNWRQCHRTRLTEQTTSAVFICDVLDVEPGDAAGRADEVADRLEAALRAICPGVRLTRRIVAAS